MIRRSPVLAALLAVLGLTVAGVAFAQQTETLSFTGTSAAPGVVKRTIIDITKPGVVPNGARKQGVQACTPGGYVLYITVPAGKTQNQIGLIYRNAATAAAAAQDPCPGYVAFFVLAPPDSHVVGLFKPTGTFSTTDSGGIPGVQISSQHLQANNGAASSEKGIAALGMLLAGASVFILRRRTQA